MTKKRSSVTVADIQLPITRNSKFLDQKNAPNFIYKKGSSPFRNLQQLALAVSCYRPVLLQGPAGSGKTSTVEYLAFVTGHKLPGNVEESKDSSLFLKVQLGEQTDSRVLLGGYQCTEIPGEFVWKPGVLTQAVIEGHWLLLEDIDCTSSDVVTVIDNLVKTQSLSVPGYGDNIIPHRQFQLFATQRTLRLESTSVRSNVLKNWITIHLSSLSSSEIVDIITEKYPKLRAVANRIVSILDVEYASNRPNFRIPSLRDILKWCNRCHDYFQTGSLESTLRIFHDAVDIFCGFMEKDLRFTVANQIGIKLGIVQNKANFISTSYKPNILISQTKLLAGRACLEIKNDNVATTKQSCINFFSLTTQACCLIEKISCCLENDEPVLLVGETGCGKTTVLQHIAGILGKTLIVINMNQQSDAADLIGGFKPVPFKWILKPFFEEFEVLFRSMFDCEKNALCLEKFSRLIRKENWDVLMNFIIHVQKRALELIHDKLKSIDGNSAVGSTICEREKWKKNLKDWEELGAYIEKYSKQKEAAKRTLVFSFIEGSLVTAIKKGYWVLLDEINLANSETLDCLSGLLESSRGSISLLEKGDGQPVLRDSGFRLFAAMNPASDVGKKPLPVGLRNRFTEFFIDELDNQSDLLPLVETYLRKLNVSPVKLKKIVKFYLKVKKSLKNEILDGNGRKPHYSLRNLCRSLMITAKNPCGSFARSLYEGLNVSFLTQLDTRSYKLVNDLIAETVTDLDIKSIISRPIPKPVDGNYINLEGFWLPTGTLEPTVPDNYILTPTVQRHFRDLIKIVSLGSGIPVLLEGDTSVGKTSLINYLAKCTGNVCSRVNNHEHTDIQEYIGTYVADSEGKLVFKEGILCDSMRKGHWLILDELNLAPTEVLEALNRVLDDNRELFIPETQETIKAHEKFLLFATQNPPGLYGGRKELSRAFRNRFIELQFNQIPSDELVTILEKRCQLPLKYCKKMVGVMTDLQLRRRGSDIFVGKSGFITLRNLFRWGERYQKAKIQSKFYDWEQHLADEGYILLAGRVRLKEECKVIEDVIAKHFTRRPNPENLFSLHEHTSDVSRSILEEVMNYSRSDEEFKHIVWTFCMRRLAVLVCKALDFSEPVLIVGETGCGKTSIVQLLAKIRQRTLYSVNCHMHSESADFLGGLRPVRDEARASGKLFEWCDGPLITAMTTGSFFLADEISLADDSVLERLNSLLEPERTILLAEKGGGLIKDENGEFITVAEENFQFIGTMNPGGDYGKKELSPALRNRFTEVWADTSFKKFECFFEIINHNLNVPANVRSRLAKIMIEFLKWFQESECGKRVTLSIRDILTWVTFMNKTGLEWFESCIHGLCLTFLDGLGSGSILVSDNNAVKSFKEKCIDYLKKEICQSFPECVTKLLSLALNSNDSFVLEKNRVGIHPFYVNRGKWNCVKDNYVFKAPTTFRNAQRVLRGLKMNKAILLEGSPGVGKTSLVSALANASGYKLTRINLSDQTDISDLFGADLPEEGGTAGHFIWRDGPFLTALKESHWILLDELNLASQSILEGLNAVLDHRGSVYIPELNKTFRVSTETKLFGCQNPLKEGGNRRGLPKSFLNRFTQVYIEPLIESDYLIILNETFPQISSLRIKGKSVLELMVKFINAVCQQLSEGKIGVVGGPWEFNLRDITRWTEGVLKDISSDEDKNTKSHDVNIEENVLWRSLFKNIDLLCISRFRSDQDRSILYELFISFFGQNDFFNEKPQLYVMDDILIVGQNKTNINDSFFYGDLSEFEMLVNTENKFGSENELAKEKIHKLCSTYAGKRKMENLRLLEKQIPILSSLCQCANMNWLAILVGESGTGKTNSIRTFASLKGENLRIMSCNSAMDTTEILGGFEQTDYNRHLDGISESTRTIVLSASRRFIKEGKIKRAQNLLEKWMEFDQLTQRGDSSAATPISSFQTRMNYIQNLLDSSDLKRDTDLKKLNRNLQNQLQRLKDALSLSDNLIFGGEFEWVDSVLVRSLKDGSWLLMEDVNLCSNAVLDRLNALLEPNGTLTVGERGAGADGKIVSIERHPNFRLFFTMDPRNGTISRAMRNRGVEIYILPDFGIRSWPKPDLLSLLTDSGVADMESHKALIELELNTDLKVISNLISNGFWTSQYVRHGFSRADAFKKSSEQVYNQYDFSNYKIIEELSLKLKEGKCYDLSLLRPPLCTYIVDSRFARLKQTCALLHLVIEVDQGGSDHLSTDIIDYLFGSLSSDNVSLYEFVKFNILHIFLTSTKEIINDLNMFINNILLKCKNSKLKRDINNFIAILVNVFPQSDTVKLPWDLRWYEYVGRFFSHHPTNVSNKFLVLMKYLISFPHVEDDSTSASLTVERYSKLVEEGLLEDSFADQPIVSKFNKYLKDFDELVMDTLKCDSVTVTDEEAIWFLNAMKLKFRLGNQRKLILLSGESKKTLHEDTLTLLELHLTWFLNSLICSISKKSHTVFRMLPKDLRQKYIHFHTTYKNMICTQNSVKLMKTCNTFRQLLGHCSPKKYLLKENDVVGMDVDEVPTPEKNFKGDTFILRSILNDLIVYFNLKLSSCYIEKECDSAVSALFFAKLTALLEILGGQVKYALPLLNVLKEFVESDWKDRQKLSSELLYASLKILNLDYEFGDEVNEESEKIYLSQVLPFHRAVWTCRILGTVYDSEGTWTLSSCQKSQNVLTNLMMTVFPNIFRIRNKLSDMSMDCRMNEQKTLSFEINRVVKIIKKSLQVEFDSRGLKEILTELTVKSNSGIDKIFYTRLDTILGALLAQKLDCDSGFEIIGSCWLLLGLLELLFLREGKIDPIRKKLIKANYAKEEVHDLQNEIIALELHSAVTGISLNHFYFGSLKDRLSIVQKRILKYCDLEKVERCPAKFREMLVKVESFMATFDEIIRFSGSLMEKVFRGNDATFGQHLYRKGRFIAIKIKSFSEDIKKFVVGFGDLTYPLLAASAQIEHGMNLIMSELLRHSYCQEPEVESLVNELCLFPVLAGDNLVLQFQKLNLVCWPAEALNKIENNKLLILFSSCIIKYNEWLWFKSEKVYGELMALFSLVVECWKREEEKRKKEEIEKESLYLKRGAEKCKTITEEEEFLEKKLKLFPTFENDFAENSSDEGNKSTVQLGIFSEDHLSQVSKMHMRVAKQFIALDWCSSNASNLNTDFTTPICMRFALLSKILPNISYLLNRKTDENLIPGLLLVMHAKESGSCTSEAKLTTESDCVYDFYKDKNVEEVSKCLNILVELKARLNDLLTEWPDHPVLLQIKVIIERILTFSIDSPLMRILTGLELLLESCQNWESVAHSTVSIADHLIKITDLIIKWRTLELQGWKNCLEAAQDRIKKGVYKWWFHFWCLVEEYITKEEDSESPNMLDELLTSLYNFIETSPVGEFTARLEILLSYHYHVLHLPQSKKRDILAISFWNLFIFYQQFSDDVMAKLTEDSSTIFTKLKDFVKIAKWHDITYWSVRKAIEKSHRTLFKYIKEYEVLLKEKVDLKSFGAMTKDKEKKRKKAEMNPNIMKFLKQSSYKEEDLFRSGELLMINNLQKKLEKARKFSNDIILTVEYPNLILDLDELTTSICENTEHFANLDVDRTLPQEKQKSQAKNIVHRKRRALADLFKSLQQIGLSYRIGLTDGAVGVLQICRTPPLNYGDDRSSSSVVASGETYYQKSVLRRIILENCLLNPSKEIGPQVIERLRGFSGHLVDLNRKQKIFFNESMFNLEKLRNFKLVLSSLIKSPEKFIIPKQGEFSKVAINLNETVNRVCYLLDQFAQILNSWPLSGSEQMREMNFVAAEIAPPIFMASRADDSYVTARTKFDDIFVRFTALKRKIEEKLFREPKFSILTCNGSAEIRKHEFHFYTSCHLEMFEKFIFEFKNLMRSLEEFTNILSNDSISCQLTNSLEELQNLNNSCSNYALSDSASEVQKNEFQRVLIGDTKILIENILLGIQRLVKFVKGDTQERTTTASENTEDFGGESDRLFKDHLTKKIMEGIRSNFQDLKICKINDVLSSMFQHLTEFSHSSDIVIVDESCLRIISAALPFVEQYYLLCSYFVDQQGFLYRASNKLSSVLIGTFVQVAQKGFCAPPEFEEDTIQGDEWSDKEGGGFTGCEGGGERNVSDKIESEDQLEDAKPKGSEKDEPAKNDCKEEENGIEISENFDGKSQNIDEKEEDGDDEESDKEEESDDMEMGETEGGADKLESEMWSDSENEEDEDENSKKNEGSGNGEEVFKDYNAAKEDDDRNPEDEHSGQEESDKERKQKRKDINEMEEPEDNGDQIDPYHGNLPPEPEPEPLDLPDDMQLDDDDGKGDEDGSNENPFDIDVMKEQQIPNDPEKENKEMKGDNTEEEYNSDSSDHIDQSDEKMEPMDLDEQQEDEYKLNENGTNQIGDDGNEKKEDDSQQDEPVQLDEYHPSDDKATEVAAQPAPEINQKESMSCDQVVSTNEKEKSNDCEPQETSQKSDMEPKGVGQAETDSTSRGHDASSSKKEKLKSGLTEMHKERKRQRPGKSDDNRCLGDEESSVNKRLKTLDITDEKEEQEEESNGATNEISEIYQHVSEKIREASQVLDAATKEQVEKQDVLHGDEDEKTERAEEDLSMDVDEEDIHAENIDELKPSEVNQIKKCAKDNEHEGEGTADEVKYETTGEIIQTSTVERGLETTFHTEPSAVSEEKSSSLQREEIQALRHKIQQQLLHFKQNKTELSSKDIRAWQLLTAVVDGLARDLSEQLRLILEPTRATRLKGDYRTGRRINMRKVISYIASEFRKDSIWLRRTKPWNREHEIVLAIDDSSSMSHNESQELAFESLALVFKALGLIEAGRLGVLSFGEKTKIVHKLGDEFSEDSGARIIQEFTFEQTKTLMCEMLDVSTSMMVTESKKEDVARLLLIISDGRGVFSEGLEQVRKAVRRATDCGIFVVFIIIDNPKSKDTIMDIRMPEFKDGKFIGIKSYMENFPFPYYLILRDINALPNTLGDALRQWFQLISCKTN